MQDSQPQRGAGPRPNVQAIDEDEAALLEGDRLELERCAERLIARSRGHASGSSSQRRLARLALALLDEARPGPLGLIR